jgi:hypothetical protein
MTKKLVKRETERERERVSHVRFGCFTILSELKKIAEDIDIGLAIIGSRMIITKLPHRYTHSEGDRLYLLGDANTL